MQAVMTTLEMFPDAPPEVLEFFDRLRRSAPHIDTSDREKTVQLVERIGAYLGRSQKDA